MSALTFGGVDLTASASNWDAFYQIPSTVINAGASLSWVGNTLNFDGNHGQITVGAAGLELTTLDVDYVAGFEGFLTASGSDWDAFEKIPSTVITDGDFIAWTNNTLDVDGDLANYDNSTSDFFDTAGTDLSSSDNTINLDSTLTQNYTFDATGTAFIVGNNASVSGDFQIGGWASASEYYGANLVDCDNATTSKILWSDTGKWSCGTDTDTGGTSGSDNDLLTDDGSGGIDSEGNLSFDGSLLDITGSASVSGDFEVTGTIKGDLTGAVTGNATTATAFAGDPGDCTDNTEYTYAINASGTLTCQAITGSDGVTFAAGDWSIDWGLVPSASAAVTLTGNWVNTNNPWADNEVSDVLTIDGGTLNDLTIGSGKTWGMLGQLTIGDGGDRLDIATDTWDVTNGVFSNLAGLTSTGVIDFSGATSVEGVNGANPTVDAEGEYAFDTSGFGQFVYYASGSVHTLTDEKKLTFSIASSSFNTFTTREIMYLFRGITIQRMTCEVSSATSVVINFEDGAGNNTDSLTCGTTRVFDDGAIANATMTKGESLVLERGSVTGEADFLNITITITETRE